jgi:pimeloyl-ACP methyl ester carboxylesterase
MQPPSGTALKSSPSTGRGIGRSDYWHMSSVGDWPQIVEKVAGVLGLSEFAVAGWSGGGPYALACAAAIPRRVRAVATVAGMAPLLRARHVLELGLWLDKVLIPAARWTPRTAAGLVRLSRRLPDRYLLWEARRAAATGDRAALESAVSTIGAAVRTATTPGPKGMVDEYRRYYGPWGFDLCSVRQSVTIWQGEEDAWVPMNHARRLARMLPSSTLNVVSSSGHLLPLAVSDKIVEDIAP